MPQSKWSSLAEFNRVTKTTHGLRKTCEWSIWQGMRQRCENPNSAKYKDYGDRGIKVCKRWDKFENFLEDMGKRPSIKHGIDRINNDGNYEPKNCRWATPKEQLRNTRVNRILDIDGVKLTMIEVCEKFNIPKSTLRNRLERGLTAKQAITIPIKHKNKQMITKGK